MKRFKHTERTAKIFNNILNDYWKIHSDGELEKRHLSYDNYQNMGFMIDGLRFEGSIEINDENIANYFGSFGCLIERIADRFRVSL